MLTINDIRNPKRTSGFNHVTLLDDPAANRPKPYRARVHGRRVPGRRGGGVAIWRGPRRATAAEAAQDYCDYINGSTAQPTPALKSAGHKGPSQRVERTERERKLRKELRTIEAERNKDRKGFVYLVGEEGSLYAVKIGHSYDPETRPNGLQTGNPRRLVVLASMEGTLEDEAALHQRYIEDNVLQEWFRPSEELLSEFGLSWENLVKACSYGIVREEAA